jgi:hypothetical protein
MIADMLEGMEHEEAGRLAGLRLTSGTTAMKKTASRDCETGRAGVDSHE